MSAKSVCTASYIYWLIHFKVPLSTQIALGGHSNTWALEALYLADSMFVAK